MSLTIAGFDSFPLLFSIISEVWVEVPSGLCQSLFSAKYDKKRLLLESSRVLDSAEFVMVPRKILVGSFSFSFSFILVQLQFVV